MTRIIVLVAFLCMLPPAFAEPAPFDPPPGATINVAKLSPIEAFVNAEIASGVLCRFSSRKRAVTTISSRFSASAPAANDVPGKSVMQADVPAAIAASFSARCTDNSTIEFIRMNKPLGIKRCCVCGTQTV